MTATSDQIIQAIEAIHTLAKQSFHRRMVVFSGSNPWCMNLLKEYLSHANTKSGLLVSNQIQLTNIHTQRPEKLSQVLGTEYEILIWDGFSGINPDSFGIASGLVKGGGLFFLLLPELESFQRSPDPDYLRMCSDKASVNLCHTFFLQRLVNHLKSSDDICIVEEAKPLVKICVTTKTPALPVKLPSADQKDAIEAIKKVSFGHRHRPLVIKANRGRGKSSVLGIAAAQVYITAKHKMIITGPSKKTCDAAFKHYKIEIERHFSNENDVQEALSSFKFVALDSMLGELPSCHLLFIDEAAAIPTSILTTLLKHYPRLVYATTIHGYEGNGQGFAIRFHETLSNIRPQWQAISLYTPIRWQEHDPLETWFFNVLLLNTELFQTHLNEHINLPKKESLFPLIKTTLIDQQSLHKNELILKQIVSLLVIAHYQTSPSDIRLILDHPKVNIIIAYLEDKPQLDSATSSFTNSIVGVSLTIEEGGIQSEAIAQGIIFGERRPRGQLFPQALCASSADAKFLEQTCYRVMRIAVHPDFQQQGIGSALLDHLYEFAKQNNIDSVATSYGLSTELFSFWQ